MAGIFRAYDVMQDYENIDFVKVATDSLQNGFAVVADALTGSYLDGFGGLYTPATPTITSSNIAIVCGEEYYQDASGNRLNINDPTLVIYTTGQRIRVFRPAVNKKYFMSNDLITGTPVAGQYLIPSAGAYTWTVAADLTANPKVALKIEAINVNDTFVGLSAVTGVRLRCTRANNE